jgi:hypothetical protein
MRRITQYIGKQWSGCSRCRHSLTLINVRVLFLSQMYNVTDSALFSLDNNKPGISTAKKKFLSPTFSSLSMGFPEFNKDENLPSGFSSFHSSKRNIALPPYVIIISLCKDTASLITTLNSKWDSKWRKGGRNINLLVTHRISYSVNYVLQKDDGHKP